MSAVGLCCSCELEPAQVMALYDDAAAFPLCLACAEVIVAFPDYVSAPTPAALVAIEPVVGSALAHLSAL